ncbi:MAG: flagellar basal-body MS-ring/collar protein FliF [Bacillota bacterium]
MNQFMQRLRETWSGLTGAQKSMAMVVGVAVLLAALFFWRWAAKVEYVSLYTELDAKSADTIVNKLKDGNVPYRLDQGGATILVPKDQVYELRLEVAGEGLLGDGGMGFELFDQTKLGITDFERQVNYQRALQEELRRSIVLLDGVADARVNLVLPQKSVFVEEETAASAAVTLKLKSMARIRPEEIRSIVYLVSSSVENLPVENVRVINTTGQLLSEGIALDNSFTGDSQSLQRQDAKRAFEKDLETRVQQALERIFGAGNVVVMVSADLDFDQRQVTKIEYGDQGVVRSEKLVADNTNGVTAGSGGQPGTSSNSGTFPITQGTSTTGTQNDNHQETTRNYEINQSEEKVVYAPGELLRLSTSVTVNGTLNQTKQAEIQSMVAAATGYQPQRNDQISITSMDFQSFAGEQPSQPSPVRAPWGWPQYAILGGVSLAVVLALIVVAAMRKRSRADLVFMPETQEVIPVMVEQVHDEAKPPAPVLQEEERRAKEEFQRAKEVVARKPDEAVQLIKVWLAE